MGTGRNEDMAYRTAVKGLQGIIHILLIILLCGILLFLGRQAYTLGYSVFNDTPMTDVANEKLVTVTITDDMSVLDIGRLLNEEGLIDESPLVFYIQERLSDYHDKILPGTYILKTSQNVEEMLPILTQENTEGQPIVSNEETQEASEE